MCGAISPQGPSAAVSPGRLSWVWAMFSRGKPDSLPPRTTRGPVDAELTCAPEGFLARLPEPHVETALDELVVSHLPNVLDGLAPVVAAATAVVDAVQRPRTVLAQRLCHPPRALAPVAAAHGREGEGEGQADREEGQSPLLPGPPVHG